MIYVSTVEPTSQEEEPRLYHWNPKGSDTPPWSSPGRHVDLCLMTHWACDQSPLSLRTSVFFTPPRTEAPPPAPPTPGCSSEAPPTAPLDGLMWSYLHTGETHVNTHTRRAITTQTVTQLLACQVSVTCQVLLAEHCPFSDLPDR